METLLICPATRAEIVTGKFFTVMGFSLTTALLNLVSIGFTGKYGLEMVGAGAGTSAIGDVSFPPFSALCWVVLMALPVSALFSALSLAFAMFARSSKEGQYYLTPLLMIALGLTVMCLHPAVEMTWYNSLLPVLGPSLLLKSLLLGPISAAAATKVPGARDPVQSGLQPVGAVVGDRTVRARGYSVSRGGAIRFAVVGSSRPARQGINSQLHGSRFLFRADPDTSVSVMETHVDSPGRHADGGSGRRR